MVSTQRKYLARTCTVASRASRTAGITEEGARRYLAAAVSSQRTSEVPEDLGGLQER